MSAGHADATDGSSAHQHASWNPICNAASRDDIRKSCLHAHPNETNRRALAHVPRRSNRCECGLSRLRDRRPTRLETLENLGLGLGDLFFRREVAEMHGQDVRDDRHVRPHHLRQRRDLARMVHADLEDAELGVGGHAGQGQRHAPVIVVGFLRGVHLAAGRETNAQHLLGAGLSERCLSRRRSGPSSRAFAPQFRSLLAHARDHRHE